MRIEIRYGSHSGLECARCPGDDQYRGDQAAMDCRVMRIFARAESGMLSVGLNAVEFVTDIYR
jgi:hypothetical protein